MLWKLVVHTTLCEVVISSNRNLKHLFKQLSIYWKDWVWFFYYLCQFWYPSKRLKCYYTNCFWAVSLLFDPRMTCHFSAHFYSIISGSCTNCEYNFSKVIELFRCFAAFKLLLIFDKRYFEYVCLQNTIKMSMIVNCPSSQKYLKLIDLQKRRKLFFRSNS